MLRTTPLIAAAALLTCLVGVATAQSSQPKRVSDRTLTTKDGFPIKITYYESADGKESPVVVALHGERGNRLIWKSFAERLQNEGIAVVTVDLRLHGDSKVDTGTQSSRPRRGSSFPKAVYQAMVALDLPAVKKFIYEEHQAEKLNMRKMAIIAADFSVPIAVNFALADWLKKPYNDAPTLAASTPRGQDVRALVLLSPADRVSGITTGKELVNLGQLNLAFLVASGKRDRSDRGTANEVYEKITARARVKDAMYKRAYETAFRGTDLLGRGSSVPVEGHMLQFLKMHLKQLPDQWVDRKPRI